MTDTKTKLDRCMAKRVALERELTEVHTHLSGQGIDPASIRREPASVSESSPPLAPDRPNPVRASPGQRFRRQATAAPRSSTPASGGSVVAKPPSKQDEVLQRVRARSGKINFDRIGTAEPGHRDDLKEIKGIGIFIEKKLNALGIYTYAQIARFNEQDEQIVNAAIEFFPGRIARDEWVSQARELIHE